MARIVFHAGRGRLPATFPRTGLVWQPGPAVRAGAPWVVDTPITGMLNIAGIIDAALPGVTPWIEAGALTVAQDGTSVRVTLDGASISATGTVGAWSAVTLLAAGATTAVVVDGTLAGTLPSTLDEGAPATLAGDVILALGSHRLGIPLTTPHTWNLPHARLQHARWRALLNALALHDGGANVGGDHYLREDGSGYYAREDDPGRYARE